MSEPILTLENVTMQFGGLLAISDLSMQINNGEIVALIGPNGAGKTTAFNCVTGVYEPTNGAICYNGKPIAINHPSGKMKRSYAGNDPEKYLHRHIRYSPDRITNMGIARTFQNIRLFKTQTAFENVLIATHLRCKSNIFTAAMHLNWQEEKRMREKAMAMLDIVGLADLANEKATSLPYGSQRRLEIARALATDPRLLLLDEPAAGMNPQETEELGAFIQEIKNKFDLSVFLIEHHMNLVMGISDRVYVVSFGKLIAQGTPAQVQDDPAVISAYLGGEEE